jgi:hypothetical protein
MSLKFSRQVRNRYLDEAQRGPGPATFSFGSDDEGLVPQFRLSCEGSNFVLTNELPN